MSAGSDGGEMNTDPLGSKRDQVARLRAAFVAQLPGRIAAIRLLFDEIVGGGDNRAKVVDLHRHFHNLKGTGGAFGFMDLGHTAERGEAVVAELFDQAAISADWCDRLAHVIEAVSIHAASLGKDPVRQVILSSESPAGNMSPELAAQGHGRLVYLCDDEPGPLEQLAAQLACFGYETATFTDVEALRVAVLVRHPDCVVMDISFPESRDLGTRIVAQLNLEAQRRLTTVFLSGRDDFDARLHSVQAGGSAYFNKPVRATQLAATLDELTQHRRPEPFRILVIDDEPEVAAYHCMILEDAGMLTQQVVEPQRALEALETFGPDMVLMDIYMPGCSGSDLALMIRQMPDYFALPIVYVSSETDRRKQLVAMRIGADAFLAKPVEPDELVSAVSIRAERMRALRSLIARDSLTSLFNHTTTTQMLEGALALAHRRGSSLCFAMIDIDHFKLVNDRFGHPVGDQVIVALARVLQQQLRGSDIVGRYGGEEFAVILQDATLAQAMVLLDKLRQIFSRIVFHAGGEEFRCTFSAGVADCIGRVRAEILCDAADIALYEAKRLGRDRVVAANDGLRRV